MTTIKANGIDISYELAGKPGAPVVMTSNSILADYGMWDDQVADLVGPYRLLRYDTRGHGGTQATPGAYTIDLLVEDARGLLDALGVDKVHFVGLSMGGMIGQLFAAKHPQRLHSLVLCDTASELGPESVWDGRMTLARDKGIAAFVGPMTERWLTKPFRDNHPAAVAKMGKMIARSSVDGFCGCAAAIKTMNLTPLLPTIKAPTQVIVGEHDVGTPVAMAQAIHAAIPGSRIEIVKDSAHMPNIEQTATFNRILLDFLFRR